MANDQWLFRWPNSTSPLWSATTIRYQCRRDKKPTPFLECPCCNTRITINVLLEHEQIAHNNLEETKNNSEDELVAEKEPDAPQWLFAWPNETSKARTALEIRYYCGRKNIMWEMIVTLALRCQVVREIK
jgi:hypothetical protein